MLCLWHITAKNLPTSLKKHMTEKGYERVVKKFVDIVNAVDTSYASEEDFDTDWLDLIKDIEKDVDEKGRTSRFFRLLLNHLADLTLPKLLPITQGI